VSVGLFCKSLSLFQAILFLFLNNEESYIKEEEGNSSKEAQGVTYSKVRPKEI